MNGSGGEIVSRIKETVEASIVQLWNKMRNNKQTTGGAKIMEEELLAEYIGRAEYEVQIDPYRGIQAFLAQDKTNSGPWSESCACREVQSDDDDGDDSSETAEKQLVRASCHCSCPSLIQWTAKSLQEQQKKRKKRKRNEPSLPLQIGRRPQNSTCPCDKNPFCLGSLGGAMDDILAMLSDNEVIEMETVVSWADPRSPYYSESTSSSLQKARKSFEADEKVVNAYLQGVLKSLMSAVPDALAQLRNIHDNLLFSNPLLGKTFRLSVPPGIENLGATCYLNTQLQCLAQNRVFCAGILSWNKPSEKANDHMTSILQLFQDLLYRMLVGPYSTINTLEFSNALGLDHYEQQDPNEFSRLFLDKLHESFAGSDLEDLMPRLFRGSFEYTTKCLYCQSTSKKTEQFMDLNLPIAKKKRSSVLEALNDTTLVECLKVYQEDERFEGTNQYFCNICNSKRDAIRSFQFLDLPPVLNVQISRYVFDREKLMKKKLSDKVLLPQHLHIKENRYRLCAIMRHKGTSAYSGHYIAEAVDWLSGQWYEFNDELVTTIGGPSSSYDDGQECDNLAGSPDAYNVYYVEEGFLAHSVTDGLRSVETTSRVASQCREVYDELACMCLNDKASAENMQRRRERIMKMFPDSRSFQLESPTVVWVETRPLVQFLSCTKMEAIPNVVLCGHGKLHPKTAVCGKLLPQNSYNAYAEAIQAESLGSDLGVPADQLVCYECAGEFQSELSAVVERIKTLQYLSNELGAKGNFSLEPGMDETWGNECDRYAYVVARKFITWYRTKFTAVVKHCGDDGPDVSGFDPERLQQDVKDGLAEEGIAVHVNGPVICQHGNFQPKARTSFQYVSWSVWRMLKAIFPHAIEVKHKRKGFSDALDDSSDDDDDELGCSQCYSRGITENCLRTMLADLATHCKGERSCTALSDVVAHELAAVKPIIYRLLHRDDIEHWQKFLIVCRRKGDTKGAESFEDSARNALLPFSSWSERRDLAVSDKNGMEVCQEHLKMFSKLFRPIVCQHGRPIDSAVFLRRNGNSSATLQDYICVLDDNTHKEFLAFVLASMRILSSGAAGDANIHSHISEAASSCEAMNVADIFHPSIRRPLPGAKGTNTVCLSSENLSMLFQVGSDPCTDPDCIEHFHDWATKEKNAKSPPAEKNCNTGASGDDPIPIDCQPDSSTASSSFFNLRVFDVEAGSDLESALSALVTCSSLPAEEDLQDSTKPRRSSRKRRTRYPLGVLQGEDTIRVNVDYNVAALRLLLLERCTSGAAFELDHELKLVIAPTPRFKSELMDAVTEKPMVVDLSTELSNEQLSNLCAGATGRKFDDTFAPSESLMLLRQAVKPTNASIPKDALMDYYLGLSNADDVGGKKTKKTRTERGFTGTFLVSGAANGGSPKDAQRTDGTAAAPVPLETEETQNTVCENGSPSVDIEPPPKQVALNGGAADATVAVAAEIVQDALANTTSFEYSNDDDDDIPDSVLKRSPNLVTRLATLLMQNPDTQNEPMCHMAAERAIQLHPDRSDPTKLLDTAYAAYLEFTLA